MKKRIPAFLLFILLCGSGLMKAQPRSTVPSISENITANGIFDKVSDRFGHELNIADVSIFSSKPFGSSNSITTIPTVSCEAGYFILYFAPNSIFTGTASVQTQSILCELFRNMSGFINSPLSNLPGTGPRINIYCEDTPIGSNLYGQASAVYSYPNLPLSTSPGILDGMVYKMITSGQDPYTSIPVATFANSYTLNSNFYHGYIKANPTVNWNYNLSTTNIGSLE